MIRSGGKGPVQDVDFRGARNARPTPEITHALTTADAIVIGPSNPIISIAPILAVPGIPEALAESKAPVVAVSPLVAGQVVKGPTAAFMEWAGRPLTTDGIAQSYEHLVDGLIADERATDIPTLETNVLMGNEDARRRVAEDTLRFALALR
jgi:LPPG:FO 2-phospho-L-lactate transferase